MIAYVKDHMCPQCGYEQEGEVDISLDDLMINKRLASAWNLTDDEIEDALCNWKSPHRHFVYAAAYWFCDYCTAIVNLSPAYWNPDKREFDLDQPRPRTPREQAEYDRQRQEAAGQMRLW